MDGDDTNTDFQAQLFMHCNSYHGISCRLRQIMKITSCKAYCGLKRQYS
jgi:hypothetical protein